MHTVKYLVFYDEFILLISDIYDTQSQDHDSMSTVVTVCPPTACRANRQPDCIFDITKHLSKRQLEYSYFDIERLSLWAGPTHWKLPRLIGNGMEY